MFGGWLYELGHTLVPRRSRSIMILPLFTKRSGKNPIISAEAIPRLYPGCGAARARAGKVRQSARGRSRARSGAPLIRDLSKTEFATVPVLQRTADTLLPS